MSRLFIIGNGFDISHGLPTAYKNFKSYLSMFYNFEIKNTDLDTSDLRGSLLLLNNAMNKACGKDWNDFENALGYINFQDYFPRRNLIDKYIDDKYQIYTSLLEKIYNIKMVTHIHNRVGEELILGHGNKLAEYEENIDDGEILSSTLNELIYSFKKATNKAMQKNKSFFRHLDSRVKEIYSVFHKI